MTDLKEDLFKSCDSYSVRSDAKIIEVLIKLREKVLELA